METSESSNQNKYLLCSIRGVAVAATPEELVRQNILSILQKKWHCPRSLIQVEKAIQPLRRRFDIVVFYNTGTSLKPLLLIECKAGNNAPTALQQLLGYNVTIQAPFIAIADATQFLCYSADGTLIPTPSYEQLVKIKI
jgi:hypothetical protein